MWNILRTFATSIRDKGKDKTLKYSLHHIQFENVKMCLFHYVFLTKNNCSKTCIYGKLCLPLHRHLEVKPFKHFNHMIQINFKIVRNGFNMCDVTYGDYNSFEEAAEQISKEVTELENASVGYFSRFNQQMVNDYYKFAWACSWDSIDEIVANNGFYISDVVNRNRANNLHWEIVVNTSTSLLSVPKYLGME